MKTKLFLLFACITLLSTSCYYCGPSYRTRPINRGVHPVYREYHRGHHHHRDNIIGNNHNDGSRR